MFLLLIGLYPTEYIAGGYVAQSLVNFKGAADITLFHNRPCDFSKLHGEPSNCFVCALQ